VVGIMFVEGEDFEFAALNVSMYKDKNFRRDQK